MFLLLCFVFGLIFLYLYFYVSIILEKFYNSPEEMKEIWFKNYGTYAIRLLKFCGLYNKIQIINEGEVEEGFNLIVMNHSSIFDNFIITKILNKYSWNDVRTVSRYSKRDIQNKVMKIHENMLLDKSLESLEKSSDTIDKWKKYDLLNIILFPEGTTYNNVKSKNVNKKILEKINLKEENFSNLVSPKDGAFNFLIKELENKIDNIYDITAVYLLNNKRVYGNEINILFNLFKEDFKVIVKVDKYNIIPKIGNKLINNSKSITIVVNEFLTIELLNSINEALNKMPKIIIFIQKKKNVFNLGLDLNKDVKNILDKYLETARHLIDFKGIIITKIDGKVRGGGMLFPAISDICNCTERSTFGLPEINIGIIPGIVSTLLNRKINNNIVKYYGLTGEPFDYKKAIEIGLISGVFDDNKWQGLIRRVENNIDNCLLIKENSHFKDPESYGCIMGEYLHDKSVEYKESNNIKYEVTDDIGIITLSDIKFKNTFSLEFCNEMTKLVKNIASNIKVIVLRSELENFHVGINPYKFGEMKKLSKIEISFLIRRLYYGFLNLFKLNIPIISILNGKVYGGGIPIALWSDFRIVTEDIDLHYGNITRGMSPAGQLSELLKNNLNRRDIMDLYLKNLHWGSKDCIDKGIANIVCKTKEDAFNEALKLGKFICKNSSTGLINTLKLLRVEFSEEIINKEAWAIANSIKQDDVFKNIKDQNDSIELSSIKYSNKISSNIGIIDIEVYTPNYCIDGSELEKNGIPSVSKYLQKSVSVWDTNEDTVSISLTVVKNLIKKNNLDIKKVGRLEIGTETSVDLAKSIKTYLMELFKDNLDLEGVDNVSACYGGVSALLNSLNWLRLNEDKYAIVVAADLAIMDDKHTQFQGGGACAILLGKDGKIIFKEKKISCMKNTYDFTKPIKSTNLSPYFNGLESMVNYHTSLKYCLNEFKKKYSMSIKDFDYIIIHGGLCKMFVVNTFKEIAKWEGLDYDILEKKFFNSTLHGEKIGSLYTASLFFSLHSLLENEKDLVNKSILFYGYGSGSASTLFAGHIKDNSFNINKIGKYLEKRESINFNQLKNIHKRHINMKNNNNFVHYLNKSKGVYYLTEYDNNSNVRKYKLF